MRYKIRLTEGVVEGEKIQTRGNDEEFPTFILDDTRLISVHRRRVIGPVNDDTPPHGIERPV